MRILASCKNHILYLQVVAEYERAVIFRLGRLRKGGSKGPGIFTVIPCIDTYRCVDLRTVSFDVPPQEVSLLLSHSSCMRQPVLPDSYMRLGHRFGRRGRLFQRDRCGAGLM